MIDQAHCLARLIEVGCDVNSRVVVKKNWIWNFRKEYENTLLKLERLMLGMSFTAFKFLQF